MLIARTKEESELYIEQEISHVLKNEYPVVVSESENYKIVITKEEEETYQSILKKTIKSTDGKTSYSTYDNGTRFIKTNSYGVLPVFDSVDEFLGSKYNRCISLGYCVSYDEFQHKNNKILKATIELYDKPYEFENKKTWDRDKSFRSEIKGMMARTAYMLVFERDNRELNTVKILEYKQINKKVKL